jgi:cytochrome c
MRSRLLFPFAALLGLSLTAGSQAQMSADATAGKAIFDSKCAICHSADTTDKKIGPGLKGLYARGTMADGSKVTDETVTLRIVNGKTPMPAFKDTLTPAEIKQVVEYLKTL